VNILNRKTSIKFANLSWLCALMVVVIHGATYAANLPGQELQTVYGMNITTYFQLFFTEGICRAAVPLFFVTSGYLYYRNFQATAKWHCDKIFKRLKTNGIPFLFWGLAVIAFFAIAQAIPATAQYFASPDRNVMEFSATDWLTKVFIDPLNSPLWFLRDLLILAVFSPLITLVCKRLSWLWIAFVAVVWMRWLPIPVYVIRIESILFFSIGAVLSFHHRGLVEREVAVPGKIAYAVTAAWLIFIAIKTYHLCALPADVLINGKPQSVHDLLTRLNSIIAIPSLWIAYDLLPKSAEKKWKLGQYGFLMFVLHHPVIGVVKKLTLKLLGINMVTVSVAFVFAVVSTCAFVILFGYLFKKFLPKLYAIVCGGR